MIRVSSAKVFRKEESISKIYLPKNFSTFFGDLDVNFFVTVFDPNNGHSLKEKRVIPKHLSCVACSQGKLISRPSPVKVTKETINFLETIQGDICGPIHPPCGTFRYYMVLIDASTRWSHVCLLSTRNLAFVRLLAQII